MSGREGCSACDGTGHVCSRCGSAVGEAGCGEVKCLGLPIEVVDCAECDVAGVVEQMEKVIEVDRVVVIQLETNDIVVLETDQHLSGQTMQRMKQAWDEHVRKDVKLVVLDGGTKIAAVLRPPKGA